MEVKEGYLKLCCFSLSTVYKVRKGKIIQRWIQESKGHRKLSEFTCFFWNSAAGLKNSAVNHTSRQICRESDILETIFVCRWRYWSSHIVSDKQITLWTMFIIHKLLIISYNLMCASLVPKNTCRRLNVCLSKRFFFWNSLERNVMKIKRISFGKFFV